MRKKGLALLTILFFVILFTSAFAQSSAPVDQGTLPGPGYGMGPGGGYGHGPGYGYGMGPGMMGPGWGGGYGYGMGPGMMGPGWGAGYGMGQGGWGIFMFIFMLIFLCLIVGAVVLLVRYLSPHSRTRAASEDALEILKRRYARGEIQKAEFEEKRKDLES